MDKITDLNEFKGEKLTKSMVESLKDIAIYHTQAEFAMLKLSIILTPAQFASDCHDKNMSLRSVRHEAAEARQHFYNARKAIEGAAQ